MTILGWLQQQAVIPTDTVSPAVVRTPLPGGVGAFVRAVLNQPPWVQKTVIPLVGLALATIAFLLWRRRRRILDWLRSRSRGWKIAMVGLAAAVTTGFAVFSASAWHYTQHNNDFCIGCHVMGGAWTKFQHSEHRTLQCHDCHRQSMFASMKQLYLWVAERPDKIPPHATVPTRICQECHNQSVADSTWKRVIATAGHSVHMRNDTAALRNVQCVTCHGAEIHHFVPVDKTCGQSGCHENLPVKLGKMAGQSSLHCTGCHAFTAVVAEPISADSASTRLVPTGSECLSCHAMKQRVSTELAMLDPAKEPHKAVCGACHNPHAQRAPKDAFATCATGSCHARADTLTPFHRGLPKAVLANCATCHAAHEWKVKSTDCAACHRDLERPRRVAPPLRSVTPNDTQDDDAPHGPIAEDEELSPRLPPQAPQVIPPDTARFSHERHAKVSCGSCHSAKRSHGEVTVKRPDGCLACHHGAEQKAECTACHARDRLPARSLSTPVRMSVRATQSERSLSFRHQDHARTSCRTCHTASLTLAAERDCASCHKEHHTATVTCASCHPASVETMRAAHPRDATHAGCGGSGCHVDATVTSLAPTRTLCLSCHVAQATHKPGGDCVTCHLVPWRGAEPQ